MSTYYEYLHLPTTLPPGVPLYFGAERCLPPLLRAGRASSSKVELSWTISGTPEVDPHVQWFELAVEAYDFSSEEEVRIQESFGGIIGGGGAGGQAAETGGIATSSSAVNQTPGEGPVDETKAVPGFINWDFGVSSSKKGYADARQDLSLLEERALAGRGLRLGGASGVVEGGGRIPPFQGAVPGTGDAPVRRLELFRVTEEIKGSDRSFVLRNLRPSRVHFVRLRGGTSRWTTDWSNEIKFKTGVRTGEESMSPVRFRDKPVKMLVGSERRIGRTYVLSCECFV